MKPTSKKTLIAPTISLFTSLGTLICCALPALMVTIGAGAALAGLVSAVPQLVWVSQYKVLVFSVSGVMILISGVLLWRARKAPCPLDPDQAKACMRLRKISNSIYIVTTLVYIIGFFFAFLAAKVLF